MGDLRHPRWIYVKAVLFIVGGLLSSVLIVLDNPSLRTAALLGLTTWCFARAYYFAFYVIQHYLDPGFRFSGLLALLRHLGRKGQRKQPEV
jgi:hypothetical protein